MSSHFSFPFAPALYVYTVYNTSPLDSYFLDPEKRNSRLKTATPLAIAIVTGSPRGDILEMFLEKALVDSSIQLDLLLNRNS